MNFINFFRNNTQVPAVRKRQPILHEKPSTMKLALGRVSIVLTVFFWTVYIFSIVIRQLIDGPGNYSFTMEAFSYAFVVSLLTFSSLMYLIARQGALERFAKHARVPRAILDRFFSENQPSITVLVPSYAEEVDVIRKTMISAALQEYPDMRIVLLLDDKPNPTNPDDSARLKRTRDLKKTLRDFLSPAYKYTSRAQKSFLENRSSKKYASQKHVEKLAKHYDWIVNWLYSTADKEEVNDHVDVFFTEQVLRELADDLNLVSRALRQSISEDARITNKRMRQLYQRLVWIFKAEFDVFERKKYSSLSHEANKAMNLNSYIGLMGGTYKKQKTENGTILSAIKRKGKNIINIPDSDFLLTLDADSILLREYCMRLVYFLNQAENKKVAVTQTPYSSFRDASSRIERLAGATTDIQHILHQGMSKHNATFWVGANAIIRKSALDDIVEKEIINGYEIKRYIQDRTVIEDTESSVDLALHGWELKNYPERLSYSATPPDFGSLVVQRRRWANGGLLIMPKLLETIRARKHKNELISRTEIMLRVNYMASIAWATFGLIFLLAYPYDGRLLSPLVLLAAMPYFLTMASDLKYCGYKYSDVFRIYGFNLIILPVNLAGVLKSIEQSITNKKIPFARTPKIKDRTRAGVQYVVIPVFIVAFSLFTVWRNMLVESWTNAAFAGFNAFAATYAIVVYIGIKNLLADTWAGIIDWLYIDKGDKNKNSELVKNQNLDWEAVLYQGS